MSLLRLNRLFAENVVPFNYGLAFKDWVRLYHELHMEPLVGSDPHSWSPERRAEIDRIAAEQTTLVERLLALPDDEFDAEVKRLSSGRTD